MTPGEPQDDLITEPRPGIPATNGLATWWRESNWLVRGLTIAVPVLLVAAISMFAARVSTQSRADALEVDLGQARSELGAAEERNADLETRSGGATADNADQANGYERLLDEASATLDELETSPTTTAAPTTTTAPPTTVAPDDSLLEQVTEAALGTMACPYELGPGCAVLAGAREHNGALVVETFLGSSPDDRIIAHSLCNSTLGFWDDRVEIENGNGDVIKWGDPDFTARCGAVDAEGPGLGDVTG